MSGVSVGVGVGIVALEEIQKRMFGIDDLHPDIRSKIAQHKQLSPGWFEQRKNRITGSKLSQFLFIDGIEDIRRMYQEMFEGRERAPFNELASRRCAFGRDHEIHAVCAYLKHHINELYLEVTFQVHPKYPSWIGATSDGMIVDKTDKKIKLMEIKCPYGDFEGKNAKAFKAFPEYYIPQIIMQQMCYCIDTTRFVVWTRKAFKVYEVSFDPVYAESLMLFLKEFYDKGDLLTSEAYCLAAVQRLKQQTRAFKREHIITLSPRGGYKNSNTFNQELVDFYGPRTKPT